MSARKAGQGACICVCTPLPRVSVEESQAPCTPFFLDRMVPLLLGTGRPGTLVTWTVIRVTKPPPFQTGWSWDEKSCWAGGENGGPALARWSRGRGSQDRPWASPRLQDCPIHSGRGPDMSGFIQQFSPLQSLKGPATSMTGALEGNGEESWRESRGSGRCQGPPLWEKQDRTIRKHKESTLESLRSSPPAALPTITGCSGAPELYTVNVRISLFTLRIMGLACTLWRVPIIIPTLQMGKQRSGKT